MTTGDSRGHRWTTVHRPKRLNRLYLKRLNQKSRATTNLDKRLNSGSSPVHPAIRLAFISPPARRSLAHGRPSQSISLASRENLLREARVLAAEEGRSISALLTDRLKAIVRERKTFDKARRRALARLREGLDLQWTPSKSRDELHER